MNDALDKLLPLQVTAALKKIGVSRVYEVRIRAGRASMVNVEGVFYYLAAYGISVYRSDAMIFGSNEVNAIVMQAAEHSVYAVQDQLVKSFITLSGGIRVGVCGQTVKTADKVTAVKEFSSVVVRIPHEVRGCSDKVPIERGSILIAGAPSSGKTTFLRDMARRCSLRSACNVVVLDERGEIGACRDGVPLLDVGDSDVVTDCDKAYGFRQAVRVLRPDVIVTDELVTEDDFLAAATAVHSGIRVFASVHAEREEDLIAKRLQSVFDSVVWLSGHGAPGNVRRIAEDLL